MFFGSEGNALDRQSRPRPNQCLEKTQQQEKLQGFAQEVWLGLGGRGDVKNGDGGNGG